MGTPQSEGLRIRSTKTEKTGVPAQQAGREQTPLFPCFCSTQAFNRLDDAYPLWGEILALFSSSIQMLISSGNTLTDILRNNTFERERREKQSNNSKIHILLKCKWKILQDGQCIKHKTFSRHLKDFIILKSYKISSLTTME